MPPLLTADMPGLGFSAGPEQWGIFTQSGQPLIAVDSTDSVEYARDYRVSDYPQEQGAFQSYNKVQVPFQAKVGFLIAATRTDFLNAIEQACASLQLVAVVTPEISYPSANLTHYSYRRDGQGGRRLIRVDVWCEEIRFSGGAALANSQSNNAASPDQSGPAQASPTTQNAPPPSGPGYGTDPATGAPATIDTPPNAGGGFSTVRNSIVPNDPVTGFPGDAATTIPPGIPNYGGGPSSVGTDLNAVVAPSTSGF